MLSWTLNSKLKWNFNQNTMIFIQENVVCKMTVTLLLVSISYDTYTPLPFLSSVEIPGIIVIPNLTPHPFWQEGLAGRFGQGHLWLWIWYQITIQQTFRLDFRFDITEMTWKPVQQWQALQVPYILILHVKMSQRFSNEAKTRNTDSD